MVRISDKTLALLLIKDGRMSFTKIAKMLGVTEAAVRKRIKKLKNKGILLGFTARINVKKLDMTDMLIGIDTLPEKLFDVISKLKKFEDVVNIWTSAGDHMIMIRAIIDEKRIEEFLKSIEKIGGVVKVCPAILIEEIK